MHFKLAIASMAFWSVTVLSTAAEDKCGDLGVMKVESSELPAGVDLGNIRECSEHPGLESPNTLSKRSCWYGANIGCQAGYCWKRCASVLDEGLGLDLSAGRWCWMAANLGVGNWLTCNVDSDCQPLLTDLTAWCGQGDCNACGCSC